MSLEKYLKSCDKNITVVIPFNDSGSEERLQNFNWVKNYIKAQLPKAEIIIGQDDKIPFSKAVAVNNAVAKASGDVLIILDADIIIPVNTIKQCVARIRQARDNGKKLWYIPYRRFYRLRQRTSERTLEASPALPVVKYELFPEEVHNSDDSKFGHWYGAGVQILPIEAFKATGGWDERFRGWGGEDDAAMRATDTLYWWHKTFDSDVYHLWHPMLSPEGQSDMVHWRDRMWAGQTSSGINNKLSGRYWSAYGNPEKMAQLINEGRPKITVPHNHLTFLQILMVIYRTILDWWSHRGSI